MAAADFARLDLAVAAIERTRRLSGTPSGIRLPRCFALPSGEEAWRDAAAAEPGAAWVMVPAVVTDGVDPVPVDPRGPVERGAAWVIRAASAGTQFRLGVIVDGLVPLKARAEGTAVGTDDDGRADLAIHALAAEFLCGSRELLVRGGATDGLAFTVNVSCDAGGTYWFDGIEPDRTPQPPSPKWSGVLGPGGDAKLSPGCAIRRPGEDGAGQERFEPRDGVESWSVGDEVAVHVAERGALLVLPPPGAYVWAACLDGADSGTIARELAGVVGPEGEQWAYNQLGALVEDGALWVTGRAEVPVVHRDGPQTPGRSDHPPYVMWNDDRVWRAADATVLVRTPSSLREWIAAAIALEPGRPGEPVTAVTDVVRAGEGRWRVCSSHHPDLPCVSAELPALVRWSVLAGAARGTGHVFLEASAFARGDGSAVIVLGPRGRRFALIEAAAKERVHPLADATVVIDRDGRIVPARTHGLRPPEHQWLAQHQPLVPDAGGPMVDPDGWLAEPWCAPLAPQGPPAAAAAVLVLGDGQAAPTPGDVLRELLRRRTSVRTRIAADEAARLIALARLPAVQDPGTPLELFRAEAGALCKR